MRKWSLVLYVLIDIFGSAGSMIDTFAWNDEIDMIAAMSDGKFVVWYYPNAVFVDEDVAAMTKFEKDGR